MEHRWGQRIIVDMPIHMSAASAPFMKRAQLANVSITGALIKADFRPRVLSRVHIVFGSSLIGYGDVLSTAAYVVQNYRHGIGVEWCESWSPSVASCYEHPTSYRNTCRTKECSTFPAYQHLKRGRFLMLHRKTAMGTNTAMETDTQIFREVVAEFKNSPILHFAKLHLEVMDSIVTISGQVNSLAQRQAAERAAKRVAGIKTLILEVRAAAVPITVSEIALDTKE